MAVVSEIALLAIMLLPTLILLLVLWNALAWPGIKFDSNIEKSAVAILIPARNEELNLADCLNAALMQGETVAEILIYDDDSSDATAQIARDYAARDRRVRLVPHKALPADWCGKTFACYQLAQAANSQWLLFLDADARMVEMALPAMLAEARARKLTLLSCWPRLQMSSFWERVLMPMLNFVVFTLFPAPLSLLRNDASLGLAHGACILAERASYFEVGGHAAVRAEIFEDSRLAQIWRACGKRGLCLDGGKVVSVRMYKSLAEIWAGFQKNFFPAFQSAANFWIFLIFHLSCFLAPFLLIAIFHRWQLIVALAAALAMRLLLAMRFNHPCWSALLHPLAEAFLIALGISSWHRCKSGRGVEWKGRRYNPGVNQL